MVFKNIHAMCQPGGWMIHIMPFESYVNHGFYSYHPGLYFDLAAANGYRLQLIGFANRKGYGVIGRAGEADEAMPITQRPVLLNANSIPLSDMLGKPDAREASLTGRIQRAALRLAGLGKDKRPTSRALTRALARTQRRTPTRKLLVFAVLEKCGDEPFRTPFQGIYSADIADAEMQEQYARD
jgi:hypothetical protein